MHESLQSLLKNADIEMTEKRREIALQIWNRCFETYDAEFKEWDATFGDAFDDLEDIELLIWCDETFDICLEKQMLYSLSNFGELVLLVESAMQVCPEKRRRVREANCRSQAIFYLCRNVILRQSKEIKAEKTSPIYRSNIKSDTPVTWDFVRSHLDEEIFYVTGVHLRDCIPTTIPFLGILCWGMLCLSFGLMLLPLGLGREFLLICAGLIVVCYAIDYLYKEKQAISLRELIEYATKKM
jgi:hypothetical protein